jgi:hypothetical protein
MQGPAAKSTQGLSGEASGKQSVLWKSVLGLAVLHASLTGNCRRYIRFPTAQNLCLLADGVDRGKCTKELIEKYAQSS